MVPTIPRKLPEEAERQRILRLNRHAAEGRPSKPLSVKNSQLYVSKPISHEACQVLYGSHKFKLGTAQALDWFLVNIGGNRQHIRHIRVIDWLEMYDLPAVSHIADSLLEARNLRSLALRPRVWTYIDTDGKTIRFFGDDDIDYSDVGIVITELALVSEKLLKSVYRAQESEDKLAGVIDIFHLAFNPYESELGQLSAFWKSAVELSIGESS